MLGFSPRLGFDYIIGEGMIEPTGCQRSWLICQAKGSLQSQASRKQSSGAPADMWAIAGGKKEWSPSGKVAYNIEYPCWEGCKRHTGGWWVSRENCGTRAGKSTEKQDVYIEKTTWRWSPATLALWDLQRTAYSEHTARQMTTRSPDTHTTDPPFHSWKHRKALSSCNFPLVTSAKGT